MGPMGSMMGGAGPGWEPGVFVLMVVLVLAASMTLVALVFRQGQHLPIGRSPTPDEALRLRYSRGDLTREQYRQAMVDILKDRYVRGELDIERFEADLERLLDEPRGKARVDGGTAAR